MSKFHKNAIITGRFDSFCLLCEVHLKQNADDHIEVPDHKAMLQESSYVPKYQSHNIRKVSKGYYCEFCNILLPTLAKTGLHVSSKDHLKLKGNQLLKEVEEGVIAFDEIFICKKAWNGLIDDTCLLCNAEFIDENEHVKDSSHILKLIQSEVELKCNENCGNIVYRNVDASILHCLICNIVIGFSVMETHFESNEHFKKVRECCNDKNNLDKKHSVAKNTKTDVNGKELSNNDNRDEPESQAATKISAKSEKTNEDKIMKKDKKDSEVKSEMKSEEKDKVDCEVKGNKEMLHPFVAIEEAKVLAKENQIIFQLGKQSAFCKLCNVTISSSLMRMKEHIQEGLHKEKLNKKTASKNTEKQIHITKVTINEFIDEIRHFKRIGDDNPKYIIINNEICISYVSFLMIVSNGSVIRCQVCEEKLSLLELFKHITTERHLKAMMVTPVITSLKTEFVREIRPDIYHCGFCNLIVGNWQHLSLHLMSETHAAKKQQSIMQGLFLIFSA